MNAEILSPEAAARLNLALALAELQGGDDDYSDLLGAGLFGKGGFRGIPSGLMTLWKYTKSINPLDALLYNVLGSGGLGLLQDIPGAIKGLTDAKSSAGSKDIMDQLAAPGVPKPGARKVPLGLGVETMGATDTTVQLVALPQVPIRVEKVLLSFVDVGAVAAGQNLVSDIKVGTSSQLAGVGDLPIETFAQDVFDNMLIGDTATPGISVTVDIVRTVAPGAGTSVIFSGSIIGTAIQ